MMYQMPINTFSRQFGNAGSQEPKAQQMFDRTVAAGKMKKLLRSSKALKSLKDEAARLTIRRQRYAGTRTVALRDIQGSVDKADDFDRDFRPLSETTENRWVWVATAMLRGESLPPVELILLGDVYYVVDGHHRISVAKMLKYGYVDAVVTVWETK